LKNRKKDQAVNNLIQTSAQMKKYFCVILLILPLFWLISCEEKSNELDYNPNVLSSKDYIRAEDALFEILNAFLKGVHDSLVEENCYGYIDACEVCYFPDENLMTFGYGDVNRMCQDNKFRRGSFNAYFSGPVFEEGVSANILTDELYVDDSLVEADFDLLYTGLSNANLPEYALSLDYCKIKLQDSTKINGVTISADFVLVWKFGYLTPVIHEDDIYYISGTAAGKSSDGYEFSVYIQDALENYVDCAWLSNGLSKITVPAGEFQTADIDYIAEDGCFNEFNIYVNENLFFDVIK
jgi:hypothetical protein